jgi:MHS family proline/betaine transporter-like MFS transporter
VDQVSAPLPSRGPVIRAIAAASLGNVLEWYDFTIYVLFAIPIARNFFPGGSHTAQMVRAGLAFGAGFLARPLGALFIGVFADRRGRKAALTLTIALMAMGTLILAVTPSYASIGLAAPLLILLARVIQGFSAGGEIGAASTFLVEQAPPGRKGIYAAWLQASMALSNIMGALVGLAVSSTLSEAQVERWGWRLPFIVGLLIAPVGLWIRQGVRESPDFQPFTVAECSRDSAPRLGSLARQGVNLVRAFGLSLLWVSCVYALIIYMPVHVQESLGFSAKAAFGAALAGNAVLALSCFVSGAVGDRIGRRRLLTLAAGALLVGVFPLMTWLKTDPSQATLIMVQSAFGALVGLLSGAMPAALAEIFPARGRVLGMSISYNAAAVIFGGLAPALLALLAATRIGALAPAAYVAVAAAIALPAIRSLAPSLTESESRGFGGIRA